MGILERFSVIMSSNINALLDKMEDPSKMIDQALRDLDSQLGQVKAETAAVIAEEKRCKRQVDECTENISKYAAFAEKAVVAGNDSDAIKFLEEKSRLEGSLESLKAAYNVAATNSEKMRQMHDKLQGQISELSKREASIKAKLSVAKTQEKINNLSATKNSGSLSTFERMEDKANRLLDQADAIAELNTTPADQLKDLESKYGAVNSNASDVQTELEKLKERLGKN